MAGKSRELLFYVSARLDGLQRRVEEIGVKMQEDYENRDDNLEYRSVTFDHSDDSHSDGGDGVSGKKAGGYYTLMDETHKKGTGELAVMKMTEKYRRNDEFDAEEDVRKITFYITEDRIRLIYHFAPGRITSSSCVFSKDRTVGPIVTPVDPFSPPPKDSALEETFQKVLVQEKDCFAAIKDSDKETTNILKLRKKEEGTHPIALHKSIFESAREKGKEDAREPQSAEESEDHDKNQVDYLTPFLSHVADVKNITRDEGLTAKDQCLKALKDRLLERSNIIQSRLDEENQALAKKQATFQRSRDQDSNSDEEFERMCSDHMFKIQILEQRLARHEETALQKYADMDQKLRNDPRLGVLKA